MKDKDAAEDDNTELTIRQPVVHFVTPDAAEDDVELALMLPAGRPLCQASTSIQQKMEWAHEGSNCLIDKPA